MWGPIPDMRSPQRIPSTYHAAPQGTQKAPAIRLGNNVAPPAVLCYSACTVQLNGPVMVEPFMNDIRFIQPVLNGQIDIALGSDSVVPASLSNTLPTIHRKALAQARSLRFVQPHYIGYSIRGCKARYFSEKELAAIHA